MKNQPTTIGALSVISFQENGYWVAQCLEYDIAAQAETLSELPAAFSVAFVSHLAVRDTLGQGHFEGVPRAKEKYWKLYGKALSLKGTRVPVSSPDNLPSAPVPLLDMRVSA